METDEINVVAEDKKVDIGGVMYHPSEHRAQAYATDWTRKTWNILDDDIAADMDFLKKVKVTQEESRIFIQIPGQPKAEMFPKSKTEFFFKIAPSTVRFFKNDRGEVEKLILYSEGKEFEAKKVR